MASKILALVLACCIVANAFVESAPVDGPQPSLPESAPVDGPQLPPPESAPVDGPQPSLPESAPVDEPEHSLPESAPVDGPEPSVPELDSEDESEPSLSELDSEYESEPSLQESDPDYESEPSLLNGLEQLDILVEAEVKSKTPRTVLNFILEQESSIDSYDLELGSAITLIIELSKVNECNDDVLELVRQVPELSPLKQSRNVYKVLKDVGFRVMNTCKEYIKKEFNELQNKWKGRGMDVAMNEADLADYRSFFDENLREFILKASEAGDKPIKFKDNEKKNGEKDRVYEAENIEPTFKKYFVEPCLVHNDIMGAFLDSVIAGQALKNDDYVDSDKVSEYSPELQTTVNRYRTCEIILNRNREDLERMFNVKLA